MERIEETISHARFHIKWVFGTSLITKTKGEHRSSSPIVNLANFLGRDSGMPSLPSRDFSLNSLAKIVIFQTNAQFVDIFSSVSSLSQVFDAKIDKLLVPAEIIVNL